MTTDTSTNIYAARDGSDDGTLGELFLYQGKPRWIPELNVFQGSVMGLVSEYRRKPYPIANGEMALLVIDPTTLAMAVDSSTAAIPSEVISASAPITATGVAEIAVR